MADFDSTITETFGAPEAANQQPGDVVNDDLDLGGSDVPDSKGDKSDDNGASKKPKTGDNGDDTAADGKDNPDADDDGDADGNDKGDQKHKKNRRVDRIKKLVERNKRIQAELEELKAKAGSGGNNLPLERPNPEKYTDQRQFDFDMGQYISQQKYLQERQQLTEQHRLQSEVNSYKGKILEGSKRYEDFDEKVGSLDFQVTPELHAALQVEDNAADLLYYFGDHPEIAEEVLSLPSYQQAKQIAEICSKIRAKIGGKSAAKSVAAPPTKKVATSAPGKASVFSASSFDEHCKLMAKIEREKQKSPF
jgi:hypothetical protein